MTSGWASRLGWAVVLVAGCVMGGWIANSRLRDGASGLLPRAMATVTIEPTPDVSFIIEMRRTADEAPKIFDGKQPVVLEPGDYFLDVVPASPHLERKRLKMHLSSNQKLALPIVLNPKGTIKSAPPPPAPIPALPLVPAPALPAADSPCALDDLEDDNTRRILGSRSCVAEATPVVESKSVNREALARFVKARKSAIRDCYEKELTRHKSLKGKLVVHFTITPTGRTSEVAIEENTMGSDAVSSCMKSIVRRWVLPFRPTEDVPVEYPFVFSPADEAPRGTRKILY